MHPGGLSVLLDEEVGKEIKTTHGGVFNAHAPYVFLPWQSAGQDATNVFFSLHRYEVLQKPQYARLQIGVVADGKQQIFPRAVGGLSNVPYSEPTWLTRGYYSPYYKDVRCLVSFKLNLLTRFQHHRRVQVEFRKFVELVLLPDAQAREEDGKRPSQSCFDEMAKLNIIAMRLGPGKHLQGRVLMNGIVKPEEVFVHWNVFLIRWFWCSYCQFDYFHELIMAQEVARLNTRGYYDGLGGGTYIGNFLFNIVFPFPYPRWKVSHLFSTSANLHCATRSFRRFLMARNWFVSVYLRHSRVAM
jgi:hypothetical protein